MSDQSPEGTGNEQPTELRDSSPNAGGPERAGGEMGVSSERVGPTGPGQHATDGERDTTEPPHRDHGGDLVGSDAEFAPEPEENPDGIEPKAGYPSKDPAEHGLAGQGRLRIRPRTQRARGVPTSLGLRHGLWNTPVPQGGTDLAGCGTPCPTTRPRAKPLWAQGVPQRGWRRRR